MNHRYDFVYLFDVKDGNPNGDPDAGNLPRVDAETGHGLVTDVCLKRKIRNFIQLLHASDQQKDMDGVGDGLGYDIYVREKAILNEQHERAYKALGIALDSKKEGKRKGGDQVEQAKKWMCQNFFDIRTFGAVMSTEINCGQVRGPVQFTFGRSLDPVIAAEHSITRMAVTTVKDSVKQDGDNRTMGRKFTIPYGLYRAHGFVSAPLAKQTGFCDTDLERLWQALEQMFEHDRSASRGEMSARALILFRHDSVMGNAQAHALFDRVTVVQKNADLPPRSFGDYEIQFDHQSLDNVLVSGQEKELGNGVTLMRRV